MEVNNPHMIEVINKLKVQYLLEALDVKNAKAVSLATTYASFLNQWGVHPDTFFLFLEVLGIRNKWVVEALTAKTDLVDFLEPVLPSHYLLKQVFDLLRNFDKGSIHENVLTIFVGMIYKVYKSAVEGYRLYPLTISDLNNLAKHLIEDDSPNNPVNKNILAVLNSLSKLEELETSGDKYDIAKQSGKIRANFFDSHKSLDYSITENMLKKVPYNNGQQPEYLYGEG